jgi:hypothetical protein
MKKPQKNRFFSLGVVMAGTLVWSQCGSGTSTGSSASGSSSLPDPTAAIASQVGSTNQQILEDVIHFERNLASGSSYDFEHVVESLGEPQDPTNPNLIKRMPLEATDSDSNGVDATFEYSESENCALGGTKTLVGELTVRLEPGGTQGSLSGDYFVVYDSCVVTVHVSTATEPCDVETQIEGTLSHTIDIDFLDLNDNDLDSYAIQNSASVDALEFSINEGATRTADFDLDVTDNSQFNSPDVSGTVTFDSQNYDMNDMADFIADTSASSVCP